MKPNHENFHSPIKYCLFNFMAICFIASLCKTAIIFQKSSMKISFHLPLKQTKPTNCRKNYFFSTYYLLSNTVCLRMTLITIYFVSTTCRCKKIMIICKLQKLIKRLKCCLLLFHSKLKKKKLLFIYESEIKFFFLFDYFGYTWCLIRF